MSTYQTLLAQRDVLETAIRAAKTQASDGTLNEVRRLVQEDDIGARKLHGAQKSNRSPADRYRDPETYAPWSGRSRPPAWIDGKDRTLFEIQQAGVRP
ncbi:H-NS histone family protein [Burkholderia sp. Ac-20345]|uniref:H-NS histone family protein n=1 Tax=Burkholderia sp. Ac-20345 TaxID=2703891 RepID=UPI00197C1C47|nr:H-NS histone family protein [Burkholderia sp. Ac-20345]MBN3776638.1 H-NS histone family protein [Burkholderia sp. Ac-20345]